MERAYQTTGKRHKKRVNEVSLAVFKYDRYGGEQAPLGDLAWNVTRWRIAERFKWSLEYIDSLPYAELVILFGMDAAQQKQHELDRERAKRQRR